METVEEFYDNYYFMHLINRLKIFLLLWAKGKYSRSLTDQLQLTENESIEKYTEILVNLGFVTIDEKVSPDGPNKDKFIYISDENFKNIFKHIFKSIGLDFNQEIFETISKDRENVELSIIDQIQFKLETDQSFTEKQLFFMLEKSISYFFVFLIKLSPTVNTKEDLTQFFTGVSQKLQRNMEGLYSSEFSDIDKEDNTRDALVKRAKDRSKREYLRESFRVWASWRSG